MKFTKVREVRSPERGTKLSSGIDFFIPDDFMDLYRSEGCKFTPSELVDQQKMKDDNFIIESERPIINIPPFHGILIPSGIKVLLDYTYGGNEIGKYAYDLVFDNKSGICSKLGLVIGAKVVDSDYRGEIHIHLINTSPYNISLNPGMKIAQGIVRKVNLPVISEIDNNIYDGNKNTERGEGGFGSTNN